jgi:hypothetical protein
VVGSFAMPYSLLKIAFEAQFSLGIKTVVACPPHDEGALAAPCLRYLSYR